MSSGDVAGPGAGAAPDARIAAAERLLADHGIPGAHVTAAGPAAEIAAIETAPRLAPAIAGLAPRLRALGFRFVTLDLNPGD